MWDGSTGMLWTPDGGDAWFPLETAQFPDFARHFAAVAPPDLARFAPPFLVALIEPGVVQIWSGWVARTKPGWSLHVRSPVNFPHPQGVDFFEGIVETDGWFGPLFVNIRLTKTDAPVLLRSGLPVMQATPVRRSDYSETVLNDVRVFDKPSDWTDREWEGFRRTVAVPNLLEDRPLGLHASLVRRARKRSD